MPPPCRSFELGAEVLGYRAPLTDYAIATYYIIATAGASANLARFLDGIRYGARGDGAGPIELYGRTRGAGFGAEVSRRIILGTFTSSAAAITTPIIWAAKRSARSSGRTF